MATRVVGLGLPITKSGNVITLPCATKGMEKYTTAHYLINITAGEDAQAITAVGGADPDANTYQVTVADASGWTTGDKVAFSAANTLDDYSTLAAGNTAAAASGDWLDVYPNSTTGTGLYHEQVPIVKSLRIDGMADGIIWQCANTNAFDTATAGGDIRVDGIELRSYSDKYFYRAVDTAGVGTFYLTNFRCHCAGNQNVNFMSYNGDIVIYNGIFGPNNGNYQLRLYGHTSATARIARVYNNTFAGSNGGFEVSIESYFTVDAYNNQFVCGANKAAQATLNADYNMSSSATFRGANGSALATIADAGILPHCNWRTLASRQVAGTTSANGTDLTTFDNGGLTTDIDGRPRTTYAMGASEGFRVWPGVAVVTEAGGGEYVEAATDEHLAIEAGGTAWGYEGGREGTLVPDYSEPENTLTTDTTNGVQGTWHKATAAYYKLGETFGVDGTSEEGEYNPGEIYPPTPDEHGTLILSGTTASTVSFRFTAGTGFDSGTLWYWRGDTGELAQQALSEGYGTVTGLPGGVRVMLFATSLDENGDLLGVTAPLITFTRRGGTTDDDALTLSWRTDAIDWQSADLGTGLTRINYPVNVRGYWYQQRLFCDAQNVRMKIRGMKLQVLVHGRGGSSTT